MSASHGTSTLEDQPTRGQTYAHFKTRIIVEFVVICELVLPVLLLRSKSADIPVLVADHDVTRTPTDWMRRDAPDEDRLLDATAQGRCIFTFNIRGFQVLSQRYSKHAGIVLATQSSWRLNELIAALDRLLTETEAENWVGQVR